MPYTALIYTAEAHDVFYQMAFPSCYFLLHSLFSIDTHLTLVFTSLLMKKQKKRSTTNNKQTKPPTIIFLLAEDDKCSFHHFDEDLQKPSGVIMHPNCSFSSSFLLHTCRHCDKNGTLHMKNWSPDTLGEGSGEHQSYNEWTQPV